MFPSPLLDAANRRGASINLTTNSMRLQIRRLLQTGIMASQTVNLNPNSLLKDIRL